MEEKKVFFFEDYFLAPDYVFQPRPETELLVETAIEHIKEYIYKISKTKKDKFILVDVGTGSGCIIISIYKKIEKLLNYLGIPYKMIGIDIDMKTLKIAVHNSKTLNSRVDFVLGNLLEPIKKADFIVSNPPYVSLKVKDKITVPDPPHTIFGGEKGYEIILKLIIQAYSALKENGLLIIEVGYDDLKFFDLEELKNEYKKEIFSFAKNLGLKIFPPVKDYNKLERILIFQK